MRTPDSLHAWNRALQPFRSHDDRRGVFELFITFAPFAALWVLSWWCYRQGMPWLSALLSIPAAGFLVRLFMIQHDCGHGSYFSSRKWCDRVGRVIGVLTLTPYGVWKRTHALHHATCGDLDRRGIGDVHTLTLREYEALSPRRRFAYRVYRHPLVLFGVGPAYLFFLQHRLPMGLARSGWRPWISSQGTNVAIAALAGFLVWLLGAAAFAFVYLPIMLLAASAGVWLFYVQHQFERTSWEKSDDWRYAHAALHGSSFYDLPAPLRWLTANIGVHHVHHLCSRIPSHRLASVLDAYPHLRSIGRVTLRDSLGAVRLALWDEDRKRLVSFAEAESRARAVPLHSTERSIP